MTTALNKQISLLNAEIVKLFAAHTDQHILANCGDRDHPGRETTG